jgi:hypothetical protein
LLANFQIFVIRETPNIRKRRMKPPSRRISPPSASPDALEAAGAMTNAFQFEPTQWTLLLQAGGGSLAERRAAAAELCKRYWKPLHQYAKWSFFLSPEDAEDAVQSFLAQALEQKPRTRP